MKNNTEPKSKILSTKNSFKSRYFQVDKVTIERDGKTFTKDIVSRTPTVIILPINDKDEIYLVSQYRDSMQETLLEVVAGHMESGESELEAAQNELKEEVGLTAKTWRQLSSFYVSANMNAVVHIFYATDLTEGKQELDSDEDIEIIKVPFNKALKMIDDGIIKVSSNIAALLLLDRWRREASSNL
jgi:ADP-ribose pyrophosphatase